MVPDDVAAPKVTAPASHLDAGLVPVMVGFAIMTKLVAVLQVEPAQAA